ncbi:MAG: radical SAM protein [Verrucomicrobia bacterium]|nr:radical SAM protein [Verrucomicrobiota bacterium]
MVKELRATSADSSSVNFNFNQQPFIVIWEVTRACGLACRHCRAEAVLRKHPLELTTQESFRLIDQVARAKPTLFVLTGGDPALRHDLQGLIHYAAQLGLRVGLSPSATPEFLRADFAELKKLGVARISLSLDGATRESHDRFRGVPGTWELTMEAIARAAAAKLPVQINTTFTRQNVGEFDAFTELLARIRPVLWSVFQLVPTGRGKMDDLLTADELEELFLRLQKHSEASLYDIKTTEGQHYRRVVLQQTKNPAALRARAPLGINDGKGFVFISHTGDIQPSGFLPITAGNVRKDELLDVYQNAPLFRNLRDTSLLEGKCGDCEFKNICGGSRARAFAMTGNPFSEEPLCSYQPRPRVCSSNPALA